MTRLQMDIVIFTIDRTLREYGIYADVFQHDTLPVVVVSIRHGDWKHEHLRAKSVLSELGAYFIKTEVTDEDGSDCYSADHYFIVNGMEVA